MTRFVYILFSKGYKNIQKVTKYHLLYKDLKVIQPS